MYEETLTRLLKQVPIFAEADSSLLLELARHGRRRKFGADEALFHEGDPGQTLYAIVSGRAHIEKIAQSGDTVHHATRYTGECGGASVSEILQPTHARILQKLLDDGANPNLEVKRNPAVTFRDQNEYYPLTYFQIAERTNWDVIKVLLEHGADPRVERNSTLYHAIADGYYPGVHLCLDKGADPNDLPYCGLCRAIENGNPDVVDLLLKNGAHIKFPASTERCAYPNMAILLQESGADKPAKADRIKLVLSKYGILN